MAHPLMVRGFSASRPRHTAPSRRVVSGHPVLGVVTGVHGLLRSAAYLLRRSRQHCGVELVADAEQLSRINAVRRIKGETSGFYSPLHSRTSPVTGACGFGEGERGHGRT